MSAFRLLASYLLFAACSALPPLGRNLAETDGTAAEWTYRKTGPAGVEPYGPDDWYLGYPECALNRQSPINIAAPIVSPREPADFAVNFVMNECDSGELVFFSNGAVWQVEFDGCTEMPYLEFQGEKYNMLQFHIHSPSEYTFGGAEHAADIHMVHLKDGTDDELLVVGVMFDVNEYGINNQIESLWNVLGVGGDTAGNATFTTSVYDLLPQSPSFTHFIGSLTTPPCTQGVKWLVMNEPSFLGKRQLDEYRRSVALYPGSKVDEFGNTNRPVQPVNERPVVHVRA